MVTQCWCRIKLPHSYLRRGDCRAQVRSVPLVEGVDFFNELERAIRESYPKPKMMILGFPSNPTAQCVELEFFEKVVALAKRYDVLVVHDRLMPISSTMAGKRRQSCRCRAHATWRSSSLRCRKATTWRAGVSALWSVTKRWSARWHVLKLSRLRHLYAVAGGGYCGAGGRSTVRARYCRTVQTPP